MPQLPASASRDASTLARLVADLPPFYRANVGWLTALDLFDIYHAGWLRVLLGVAGFTLLVVLADQTTRLWRYLHGLDLAGLDQVSNSVQWRIDGESVSEVADRLRRALWVRRYLIVQDVGDERHTLWAVRWPASFLAHAGAILVLLGLALNAIFGWQMYDVALPGDQTLSLGYSDYGLRLLHGLQGGQRVEWLTVIRGGRDVAGKPLRSEEPMILGPLSVSLTTRGSLVRVTGFAKSGQPARLEAHPRQGEGGDVLDLAFGRGQTERYFRSLTSGQAYRVSLDDDSLRIDAFKKGQTVPAVRAMLADGETITLDDEIVRLTLDQYVVLDVRSDPGMGTIVGGAMLILAGVCLAILCRPSRLVWRLTRAEAGVHVILQAQIMNRDGEPPWIPSVLPPALTSVAEENKDLDVR